MGSACTYDMATKSKTGGVGKSRTQMPHSWVSCLSTLACYTPLIDAIRWQVPVVEGLSSCGPVSGIPLEQTLHQLPAVWRDCVPGRAREVQVSIQNSPEHFLHAPPKHEDKQDNSLMLRHVQSIITTSMSRCGGSYQSSDRVPQQVRNCLA